MNPDITPDLKRLERRAEVGAWGVRGEKAKRSQSGAEDYT
jgi:hypothetical protein